MLVQLESNDPLVYCILTVVNTLCSSSHVCPSLDPHSHTDTKQSTAPSFNEFPQSPVIDTTSDTMLRPRPSVLERKPLDPVPEESGSFNIPWMASPTKPSLPQHSISIASVSSTFTSSVSNDHITSVLESSPVICLMCNKPTDVYSEEVVSLCVLCLGTCSHRIPNLVSEHLVSWIIPSLAK